MNATARKTVFPITERDARGLVRLLGQHFGDRLVYLRDRDDGRLLRRATALGLVNGEGYLTATGCRWWRRAEEEYSRQASGNSPALD